MAKMLQVEQKKRRLRRYCVGLRRSLAMLRGQITSEVSNCEGCVVVGLNCRSPDYQEKVVIPLDHPGPPIH